MDRQYFVERYDYNYWAQRRVWECVLQLSDEDFRRDLHYSVGSILDQCAHMIIAETLCLGSAHADAAVA